MRPLAALLLACTLPGDARAAEGPPRWTIEAKGPIVADPKVACTVRLPAETSGGDAAVLAALIKVRGSSSQAYAKKSFALTFERPLAAAGLPAGTCSATSPATSTGCTVRSRPRTVTTSR